ncbi:glycerophosphodiester phosphodiesterase family protein [Brachybacterium paraconglomeratum]|uniref:glycerophosphodiester phosphodiesterase family protein n=1 Tax=Brachybacterium paraconglomeratum TaxID=173362 RepID=UPI0038794AAE
MTCAVPSAEELRAELDALFAHVGSPLVIAHRGTTLGSFPDNTVRAAIAALRSGADVVEVDVIRSADGEHYLFHDGYEDKHFAGAEDLRTLTAAEIDELSYCWQGARGALRPTRLLDLLHALPEAWLNIDRSWSYWPELLDLLTEAGAARRVLLKSPPEPTALAALAAHPTPFLYYPIVRTREQFARARAVSGLNLIGAEILAATPEDPYADPAAVAALVEEFPLVQVNALNLENGARLYLGHDDETALLEGPEPGWGPLVRSGATAIQTDWPHLLREHLEQQGRRTGLRAPGL